MLLKNIRVVIMAGGKGTRLRPYTISFPKPLVPVGDKPILDILLRQLRGYGFRDVTLTLGHLAELIEAYITQAKGPIKDLDFTFVHEDRPTGTAGSLGFIDNLDSTFLLMNGDILTDLNFVDLLHHHYSQKADVTVASYQKKVKIELGVIKEAPAGWLKGYSEKPVINYTVAMGVSVIEPSVMDYITRGEYLDFPNLLQAMLRDGRKIAIYHHEGDWLDIGNPDDYAIAQDLYASKKELFNVG